MRDEGHFGLPRREQQHGNDQGDAGNNGERDQHGPSLPTAAPLRGRGAEETSLACPRGGERTRIRSATAEELFESDAVCLGVPNI